MNYMKQIALMLGLEWDEEKHESSEFEIVGSHYRYKITQNDLVGCYDGTWSTAGIRFGDLINKIKLPQWKPGIRGRYYTPCVDGTDLYTVFVNEDLAIDRQIIERNLARKTPEEAIELAKKMLECAKGESV